MDNCGDDENEEDEFFDAQESLPSIKSTPNIIITNNNINILSSQPVKSATSSISIRNHQFKSPLAVIDDEKAYTPTHPTHRNNWSQESSSSRSSTSISKRQVVSDLVRQSMLDLSSSATAQSSVPSSAGPNAALTSLSSNTQLPPRLPLSISKLKLDTSSVTNANDNEEFAVVVKDLDSGRVVNADVLNTKYQLPISNNRRQQQVPLNPLTAQISLRVGAPTVSDSASSLQHNGDNTSASSLSSHDEYDNDDDTVSKLEYVTLLLILYYDQLGEKESF